MITLLLVFNLQSIQNSFQKSKYACCQVIQIKEYFPLHNDQGPQINLHKLSLHNNDGPN
jgi:hypothetical protein